MCCAVPSCSVISNSVAPWTIAHPAPLSMGILQTRILEWVAMPSSRGSSWPRDRTHVSCIAGRFFTVWPTREVLGVSNVCVCVCVSRSVVSNSGIPWTVARQAPLSMGILQARILEWVAISFSRVLVVGTFKWKAGSRKADFELSSSCVTLIAQRGGAECLLQAGDRGPHLCICR